MFPSRFLSSIPKYLNFQHLFVFSKQSWRVNKHEATWIIRSKVSMGIFCHGRRINDQDLGSEERPCFQGVGYNLIGYENERFIKSRAFCIIILHLFFLAQTPRNVRKYQLKIIYLFSNHNLKPVNDSTQKKIDSQALYKNIVILTLCICVFWTILLTSFIYFTLLLSIGKYKYLICEKWQ